MSGPIRCNSATLRQWSFPPQHFLYFLPLPQGQGAFRPTFVLPAGSM